MSIRKAVVSGSFYPDKKEEILKYINHFNSFKTNDETFDLFLPVLGSTSIVFFSASFFPCLIALKIGNIEGLCLNTTTSFLYLSSISSLTLVRIVVFPAPSTPLKVIIFILLFKSLSFFIY